MNSQRRRKQLWLHESTQRSLYRSLLLFLAVIPLIGTMGFVAASQTRWYQLRQSAAWRERIRNNLGLDVVFQSIEFPAPNRFRIRELICAHPETQTPILRAAIAEGIITSGGWGVELQNAEMSQEQSHLAVQILHDSFLCRPHNLVPILKLSINQVQLLPSTKPATNKDFVASSLGSLHQVQIEYTPSLEKSEIKIQAGLEDVSKRSPLMVHVVRHHHSSNPTTEWAVDTHEESLPCAPLRSFFPALSYLGPDATFNGKVSWQQDSIGWESRIHQGSFQKVSWEHFTAELQSPMHGSGRLLVNNGFVRNGIVNQVQGSIECNLEDRASIQLEWLELMRQTFDWGSSDLSTFANQNSNLVPIDYVQIGFEMNSDGLKWKGLGPAVAARDQSAPEYLTAAVRNGNTLIATHRTKQSIPASIDKVTQWFATSQSRQPTKELIAHWNAKLSTMLPPPAMNARLSDASLGGNSMER